MQAQLIRQVPRGNCDAYRPRPLSEQTLANGQPELAHADVFIGPDGRVSYLEAQEVMAAGLTIDELRDRFDAELAKYRRAPRTMITPASFRSKNT